MLVGSVIGWIIAGLIVGALARLLVPGRQKIGIALTIVLGIVGAIVGGFLYSLLFGPTLVTDGSHVYAVESAWPGWIMAVLGGALVLWIFTALASRRTW
jgi:uncharacterized membrane protein YeaQ/YmgE (transglycosylase-associated protein family)